MLRRISKYFSAVSPIVVDGTLYTALAVFLFLQNQFASDEAGKYISLELLFYIKTFIGTIAAALLAIKLFRSTAFAEHKQQMKADNSGQEQVTVVKPSGNTEHFARSGSGGDSAGKV